MENIANIIPKILIYKITYKISHLKGVEMIRNKIKFTNAEAKFI